MVALRFVEALVDLLTPEELEGGEGVYAQVGHEPYEQKIDL